MHLRRAASTVFVLLTLSTPLLAHHGMDGQAPTTFLEGLMSGLLHPVIGPDHLLAVIAIGLLSTCITRGELFALAFVVASIFGTGLHLASLSVPGSEVLVAGTAVVFGALLLASGLARTLGSVRRWAPLAVIAGGLHGYAYGEAIVGSTAGPLAAYLLGFCVIQMAVVFAVSRCARLASEKGLAAVRVQLVSGALVSVAGVALVLVALAAP